MDIYQIFCLILIGICVIQFVVFCFINSKYSKLLKSLSDNEVDKTVNKHGVRYTQNQAIKDENGEMNISFSSEDVVLVQHQTEVVGKKNKIKPGKYTLLSTEDKVEEFNIKIGSYVKEYKHGQRVVLAEGDEVTAVSCNVLLR